MSQASYSREEIRSAVREALLEALPPKPEANRAQASRTPNCQLMKQILESAKTNCSNPVAVDLSSNQKVNVFASDLAKCMQDQNVAGLIRSGRMKFKLSGGTGKERLSAPSDRTDSRDKVVSDDNTGLNGCVESGVLTEAKILAIAKNHSRIEVGKNVTLTPLAKDRARRLKLEIVRQ